MADKHYLQADDSDQVLELLRSFNAKVERLERSGFTERFGDKTPEVIAKFDQIYFENLGDGKFNLSGPMTAWVAQLSVRIHTGICLLKAHSCQ